MNNCCTFAQLVICNRIKMKAILVSFLIGILSIPLMSQDDAYTHFLILKNTPFSDRLTPCYYPELRDSSAHGSVEFIDAGSSKVDVKYTPASNFTGRDTIVVKFENRKVAGTIKYKAYIYEYVNSVVVARSDYIICDKNQQDISIDPIANDSSSYGNSSYLSLSNVSGQQHVSYSKSGNIITFSPEPNYVGLAYINYQVCDNTGICTHGTVHIQVIDPSNQPSIDTVYISTAEDHSLEISLDIADVDLDHAPKNGSLNLQVSGLEYKPYNNFNGKDTIIVSKNNIIRKFFITVLACPEANAIINEDRLHTSRNTDILFDVSLNDVQPIVGDYKILIGQAPLKGSLTRLNDHGLFKYEPEPDYEGVQTFTYKICPQGICEYAEVTLLVGDNQPKSGIDYDYSTYKNLPIVLSYNIPVENYSFRVWNDSLKFYPGWDTINVTYNGSCTASLIGYNQLVYFPKLNFAHDPNKPNERDTFSIQYCIDGQPNSCYTILNALRINIESKNCAKQCLSDCVWPGDVDMNGQVDVRDVLPMAYSLGNTGTARSYNGSSYRALKSANWNTQLKGKDVNMKHADTDGNGEVNQADLDIISNFYHKKHSLVSSPVYERGSFPFNVELLTPNADSGDLVLAEIQLGDANYPVINQTGFAYDLDYNTNVVNEASLSVNFYDNKWFSRAATTLHLAKKPWDGRLESGFSRCNGNLVSGHGGVEVLSFIVEDDVDPWRRDEDYVGVPFYFQNIIAQSADGHYQQLDDKVVYLNVRRKQAGSIEVLDPQKLLVYPNPSSDKFNLHLNGSSSIISYEISDYTGRPVSSSAEVNARHNEISTSNLQNGLYILSVKTTLGIITKKFEILK